MRTRFPKLKSGGRAGRSAVLADCAILAVAALVFLALVSPVSVVSAGSFGAAYRGADGECVSLQCAVDWQASAVEPMLEVLASEGVRITFAVTGEWAEANPGLVARMRDEGHETAVYLPAGLPSGEARRMLERAVSAIRSAAGEAPSVCCVRHGADFPSSAYELGLRPVLCTLDLDCRTADAAAIVKRLEGRADGGSIIMLQPTGAALTALPQIIKYLKKLGFAIVPTHKMLYN